MTLYDYGNTRLRARLSQIQPIGTLEGFAYLTSVDSLISALTKTSYQASIETALTYAHGYTCIAESMRRELSMIVADLYRFYDGDARRKISGIFKRNDLLNIKAILRGLSHEAHLEDVTAAFSPLGTIPEAVLVQIAKSKDVHEAISRIVVYQLPEAKPLMELKALHQQLDSSQIELALEKWYFKQVRDGLGGNLEENRILREYYAIEADIVNLNNILRLTGSAGAYARLGGNIQDYLVDAGNISEKKIAALTRSSSVEEVIKSLAGSQYGAFLQRALKAYAENGRLSEFETQMRMYALNWLGGLPKLNPLGIGVPLGYAAIKRSEIRNIRWIAKGIQSCFDPAEIKNNLERVQ